VNSTAKQHLSRAKMYVSRGEEFYRKAAEEMDAARVAGATVAEIADGLGRSTTWVKDIIAWHKTPANRGRYTGDLPFAEEKGQVAQRHARSVLRDAPAEQIAEQFLSDPAIRAKVSQAQDIAHSNLEKRSREAERQAIGEEAYDGLEEQNNLHRAEAKLFEARRALIDTLRLLNQSGAALTDSWREEFLRTFDDIGAKVELGRGLLVGALDDELDELLAEESR
jgi:hypothetical protein